MHPATPAADQAIVTAVKELHRHTAELKTSRAELAAMRLPFPAIEDGLDNVDDVLASAVAILSRITSRMAGDFERIEREDNARYDGAANDDNQREDAA